MRNLGVKCNLCQQYSPTGVTLDHKVLCDRCYAIVKRSIIGRSFRPHEMMAHIRSAMKSISQA